MPLAGYPLDVATKRRLEVGLGSRRIGRIIAYLLNRSGELLAVKAVAGAAAGNVTVTGIATNDRLISVIKHDGTGVVSDLTSEFAISAANTINNAAGTSSAGGHLVVTYGDRT